jgi:predicted ribosomally synthesized peptide with nif11-like leader
MTTCDVPARNVKQIDDLLTVQIYVGGIVYGFEWKGWIMSKQNLVAFGDRVMEDKALHNRVRTLQPNDADGLITITEEVGYSFTAKDLKEVIESVQKQMQSGGANRK